MKVISRVDYHADEIETRTLVNGIERFIHETEKQQYAGIYR